MSVCTAHVCAQNDDGRPCKTVGVMAWRAEAPVVSLTTGISTMMIIYIYIFKTGLLHMNGSCHRVLCSSLTLRLTQKPQPPFFFSPSPFFDKMQIDSICVLLLLSEWVSRAVEVFLPFPFSLRAQLCEPYAPVSVAQNVVFYFFCICVLGNCTPAICFVPPCPFIRIRSGFSVCVCVCLSVAIHTGPDPSCHTAAAVRKTGNKQADCLCASLCVRIGRMEGEGFCVFGCPHLRKMLEFLHFGGKVH